MRSTKLATILKTFNEEEWKDFNLFIRSIYFNRSSTIVSFYEQIKKLSKNWETKKLENNYLFGKLFPKDNFNEKRMSELRYTLIKLIEEYWMFKRPKTPMKRYLDLALSYNKKSLNTYSEVYLKKSLKSHKLERVGVAEYHKYLFDYHLIKHTLIEQEGKRNQEPNLQVLHDNLDAFYLCSKLKYYYKVLNYQNFRSHKYNIRMIDEVLKEAKQPKYFDMPTIQIYYHGVYTLLSLDNEQNFQALKELLIKHTSAFSANEIQDIFIIARNFCIKNLRRGKFQFVKEALDLYKIEIKEGLILVDGKIPDSSCRNVIKLSLLAQDVVWAGQFLHQFKSKISPEIYTFSLAGIYFHQQEYEAVLKVLLTIRMEEALLELAAKALVLKTYFQLCRTTNDFDYEDKLEAYLESFKMFLKRKKESVTRAYKLYLNLIKFTQAINKLYWKPKLDKSKLAEIHKQILATPETAEWDWLKEVSKIETIKSQL